MKTLALTHCFHLELYLNPVTHGLPCLVLKLVIPKDMETRYYSSFEHSCEMRVNAEKSMTCESTNDRSQ